MEIPPLSFLVTGMDEASQQEEQANEQLFGIHLPHIPLPPFIPGTPFPQIPGVPVPHSLTPHVCKSSH